VIILIEKIISPKELKHWDGIIDVYWIYTSGEAGDKFFKALKEDGKFIAAKCKKCGWVYFPPRMYCEKDFSETEYIEVSGKGKVKAFTIARLDLKEKELQDPQIYAIIDIDGTNGCIVHLLGEVDPKDLRHGLEVEPVLKKKEEREGKITDILYFRPIS